MRRLIVLWFSGCLMLGAAGGALAQAADKNAERATRRLQLQMQALQQQLQEAQAAQQKVNAEKAEVAKELTQKTQLAAQLKGPLAKATTELKAVTAEREQLSARVQALEKQLTEQRSSHEEALAAKTREGALAVRQREEQQAGVQKRLDEQIAQVAECSVKNLRLLQVSADILDRFRDRSITNVDKLRESLLGLGDVQMFNEVQEYRDKTAAERFTPSTGRVNNPP
jgi:chromosome segregation ATPase